MARQLGWFFRDIADDFTRSWYGYPGALGGLAAGVLTLILGGAFIMSVVAAVVVLACLVLALIGKRSVALPRVALFAVVLFLFSHVAHVVELVNDNRRLVVLLDVDERRKTVDANLSRQYRRGRGLRQQYVADPQDRPSSRADVREWHDSVRMIVRDQVGQSALDQLDDCVGEDNWVKWNTQTQIETMMDCLIDIRKEATGFGRSSLDGVTEPVRQPTISHTPSAKGQRGDDAVKRAVRKKVDEFSKQGSALYKIRNWNDWFGMSKGYEVVPKAYGAWVARVRLYASKTSALGQSYVVEWEQIASPSFPVDLNVDYRSSIDGAIKIRQKLLAEWSHRLE